MITELHDVHVSRELAILLKKAGFNWACRGYFDNTGFHDGSVECTNYNSDTCKYLKAPTLDVAQRWLREVKRINVEVMYLFEPCNHYFARACYLDTNTPLYIPNPPTSTIYEEVQEAGIKKALEIILKKGK